ncbi:3'-5' exonuclease [bacterium]|nr:3'-5' exonuclease [bacterium]
MTGATATAPIRLLLLDTETNGLPKNRYAPVTTPGNWPAILQLSWTVAELHGASELRVVGRRDIGLALDPAIPWDTGAAAIHGLTEAEARRGTAPATAFAELREALQGVQVVVAHNLAFDRPVIRAAAWAAGIKDVWPAGGTGLQELCTMELTRPLLRIPLPSDPTSGRWKAPRLNELYTWLYGHVYDMSGAVLHTAQSDTHCLECCVAGLLRRGLLRCEGGRLV